MYFTQAKAKLWFGIFALVAGGCGNYGECDFAPARCAQREVRLSLTSMERSVGGELAVSFEGEHRQSGNLIVELLPMSGDPATPDSAEELINVTPPTNTVSKVIAANTLSTGMYQVRVRQIDHELTLPENRPVLKVTGTVIQWRPSNPVEFSPPVEAGGIGCEIAYRNMRLNGVWVGRQTSPPTTASEIIVRRDYINCDPAPRTQFLKNGGPVIKEFDGNSLPVPSFADVWQFPNAEPQAMQAIRHGVADYQVTGVSLQNPSVAKDFGKITNATFDQMALAVSNQQPTLLAVSGQSLYQYNLREGGAPTKNDVILSSGNAKISAIIGYAGTAMSTPATGVGFLLIDENGLPYRLRVVGGDAVYDSPGTELLRSAMMADNIAPVALAAGDLNDDGRTDLAVLRSDRVVSFYLQRKDGTFYLASSMPIKEDLVAPSAIAIGQVDGQGYNDLLIGDGAPQTCGTTLCNRVSVFINSSTVFD